MTTSIGGLGSQYFLDFVYLISSFWLSLFSGYRMYTRRGVSLFDRCFIVHSKAQLSISWCLLQGDSRFGGVVLVWDRKR